MSVLLTKNVTWEHDPFKNVSPTDDLVLVLQDATYIKNDWVAFLGDWKFVLIDGEWVTDGTVYLTVTNNTGHRLYCELEIEGSSYDDWYIEDGQTRTLTRYTGIEEANPPQAYFTFSIPGYTHAKADAPRAHITSGNLITIGSPLNGSNIRPVKCNSSGRILTYAELGSSNANWYPCLY